MKQKSKIRVLRIINRFNIGGPTYNATFLTRYLSDDFETLLVGGLPEEHEADSLHIPEHYGIQPLLIPELVRRPSVFTDRKALKKLKQIIADFQPHIVHTHASKAGALGRQAAADMNVPVIVHTFHGHVFHSYFGRIKTSIYKLIERRMARKSSAIVVISAQQQKEIAEIHGICPVDRTALIPLGFDLESFRGPDASRREKVREKFNLPAGETAIAIIGRLVPVKDHAFFLDAIEKLATQTAKPFSVFIVGDGELYTPIQDRLASMNFPHVRFFMTSWVKDVNHFIHGMDIMCLTSKNEGTPVSLIESQAAGVPVVALDVGGVSDILVHGKTGLVVAERHPTAFADSLKILLTDEKIRHEMSQNGWDFVEHRFGYKRLVKDMEKLYYKLLNEKIV